MKPMQLASHGEWCFPSQLPGFVEFLPKVNDVPIVQPMPLVLPISADGDCMYNSALEGIRRLPGHLGNRMMSLSELRDKVTQVINDNIEQYRDPLCIQIFEAIRDGDISGFQGNMLESIRDPSNQRKVLVSEYLDRLDENIRQNVANNVVQQYIEMIKSCGAWGGGVELGVVSKVLDVQFIVHRRSGSIDPLLITLEMNMLLQ